MCCCAAPSLNLSLKAVVLRGHWKIVPLSQPTQKSIEKFSLFNTRVRQLFNMRGAVNRFGLCASHRRPTSSSQALWENEVGIESSLLRMFSKLFSPVRISTSYIHLDFVRCALFPSSGCCNILIIRRVSTFLLFLINWLYFLLHPNHCWNTVLDQGAPILFAV